MPKFVIVDFFLSMFDIFFIASLFLFSILCFLEFIVFNEEILLALCFFSFIFFSFNTLGDSIFDTFQSRAAKFEADLLLSFGPSQKTYARRSISVGSSFWKQKSLPLAAPQPPWVQRPACLPGIDHGRLQPLKPLLRLLHQGPGPPIPPAALISS